MYYSEHNGIMWVEESKLEEVKRTDKAGLLKKKKESGAEKARSKRKQKNYQTYFITGKRYFYEGDYVEALRFFENAYKLKKNPEYYLFIAKCHRKMENPKRMLTVLDGIQKLYPESDVADDALFEMALYYLTAFDYEKAAALFKKLTEQYPYGTSITNKQEFRAIAREQILIMEQEVKSLLRDIGLKKGSAEKRLTYMQKRLKLEQTGRPDLKTMTALRNLREKMERIKKQREKRKIIRAENLSRIYFSLGILGFCALWSLLTYRSLKNKNRRLVSMEKSLESLQQS